MASTEYVAFSEHYNEYRGCVKICLSLWLGASIFYLVFSIIRYIKVSNRKVLPLWIQEIETAFDEGLILVGITLISILSFSVYLITAIATFTAFMTVIVLWLKAEHFGNGYKRYILVGVPFLPVTILFINYWINDPLAA